MRISKEMEDKCGDGQSETFLLSTLYDQHKCILDNFHMRDEINQRFEGLKKIRSMC